MLKGKTINVLVVHINYFAYICTQKTGITDENCINRLWQNGTDN
jgi:hypothetical protein